MNRKFIVKMQFGSHVYGTNLPTSDLDYKAVHVPDARQILLQKVQDSIVTGTRNPNQAKNSAGDIDFESFSVQRFMQLLLEGQTVALNMLFTPAQWISESSEEWEKIKSEKDRWLHSGITAFVGYCRQQANKYGIKGSRVAAAREIVKTFEELILKHGHLAKVKDHWDVVEDFCNSGIEHASVVVDSTNSNHPPVRMLEVCNRKIPEHVTLKEAHKVYSRVFNQYGERAKMAETNQGVDWKALMHSLRVCFEAQELLKDHRITYPHKNVSLLLTIRRGLLPYKEVAERLELEMNNLETLQKQSSLPSEPDYLAAEELVYGIYQREVRGAE